MKFLAKVYSFLLFVILRLFWLFELFLFLRLLLKFLGANLQAPAVALIYKYSYLAVAPFVFIFSDIYWKGYLIEMSTVSAIFGYAIAAFVVFKILRIFYRDY